MPFDSQGNFTRVMNWQDDAANSIPILASRHDAEDDNFANGFNEVLCRDGRTQMTGQLKMGSNKIVGLATGTANTDAVNKGQLDSALSGAVAGKQNTITGGASSITSSNLTANRALISNGSGKVAVSTTTNTELGYVHGVTSAIQTQIDSKQATVTGAATTITGSNLTTNRALTSNGNGKVAVSTTTSTELGYVHGVTSAIQTQINSKQATITGAATTIASSDLTASRVLVSNSSGKVAASSTTATELGYVHGVTSNVQTQLNNKTGIPNYSARVQFTSTEYTPAENGIIRVMARGAYPYASISIGNFVIARSESEDSGTATEAVWAIVKAGETYTVAYQGSDYHSFAFIPFV